MRCAPLEITNNIAKKYPDCWESVESFREGKRSGDLSWDDRCYLPIAAGIAIASDGDTFSVTNPAIMRDAVTIAAIAPWRLYKQIYAFQKDMEELLFNQADNLVIPMEVLYNMPYDCIYIQCSLIEGLDGFFVHFESDVNNNRMELRLLLVDDSLNVVQIPIHLIPGNTIRDGVEQCLDESKNNMRTYGLKFSDADSHKLSIATETLHDTVIKLMQLVLYICAENKEVEEDAAQAKITRPAKSKEFIKDRFREVRKWNCGEKTGNIIRGIYAKRNSYGYTGNSTGSGSGSPKRPHARRAHWHHFWMGSATKGNRRLELKWIAPTFIHEEMLQEDVIKINEVKDSNK